MLLKCKLTELVQEQLENLKYSVVKYNLHNPRMGYV